MGTVASKGYNPNILDPNDPRFTALSEHSNRWLMANLIGEGDVYAGRGYEQVYCFNTAKKDIAVNDHVVLGNRCGRVIDVITDDADPNSDGGIAGIVVYEDMRYLPLDYRTAPVDFGYDDDATKVGRTTTYVFGRDTELAGIKNGSNIVLFQGTLMVLRKQTNNPATWNSIAQAARTFQNRLIPVLSVELLPATDTIDVTPLGPDDTVQFTATVTPAEASQEIYWTIEAGTDLSIDQTGLVTVADTTPAAVYTVTARSVADGSIFDTAELTVTHAGA